MTKIQNGFKFKNLSLVFEKLISEGQLTVV